jgi:ABC-type uncharacterized transport system substrate-binding protein
MLRLLFCFLCFIFCSSTIASTVHIITSEESDVYHQAASALQTRIREALPSLKLIVHSIDEFDDNSLMQDDLIVSIGNQGIVSLHQLNNKYPIIYSFSDQQALPKQDGNWAATVTSQPIARMANVIAPLLSEQYKKQIIISYTDNNSRVENEADKLKNNPNIIPIMIRHGDKPAKDIEDKLFNAGALIAVNDDYIWQGENARWMLYQAYRYRVPVVGYSKKFLKAGALVSVYSTLEQITEKTLQTIKMWTQTGQLERKGMIYSNFNIEFNKNIARALNMDVPHDQFDIKASQ